MLLNKRDSGHEKDYISFILDPILTKFFRSTCKYMKDMLIQGFNIYLKGPMGMLLPSVVVLLDGGDSFQR